MSKDNGGPAFPLHGLSQRNGQQIEQVFNGGMTLRDYFAAKAMQGYLANTSRPTTVPESDVAYFYALADSMLAERSK